MEREKRGYKRTTKLYSHKDVEAPVKPEKNISPHQIGAKWHNLDDDNYKYGDGYHGVSMSASASSSFGGYTINFS